MKTTKVSLDMERQIITNLIVSKEFCTGVLPMLQPKYFKTKYAKSISSWIREYYDSYQDAPGELIQSIYQEKKNSIYDDEEAESVLEVLVSLSDEYDEKKHLHNIDYAIEQAVKYLKLRSIELLKEDLERALVEGEPVKGEAVIANFSRIGRPEGDTIDILHNKMDVIDAFLQEDELLFTLPGVLKDTVGPFKRGDLSAVIAPPKGRKCVVKGTKIPLFSGEVKNIEDVIPGKDMVLAMNPSFKLVPSNVSELHVNGKQEVYKLTVRTGQQITVTKNHPLYKFMAGWQSIEKGLSVGDYIGVTRKVDYFGSSSLADYQIKFLAYMLADGCTLQGTSDAFTYTKTDGVLKKEWQDCVHLFGDTYHESLSDPITCLIDKHNKDCKSKKFLESIGYSFCKSIEKIIPDVVFSFTKEQTALFLNRLFSGDGSVYDYGISYSTGSAVMARQIHFLLSKFGIVSRLSSAINNANKRYYWHIEISDQENFEKFTTQIGFWGSKHTKAIKIASLVKGRRCGFLDSIPSQYKMVLKDKVRARGIPAKYDWPRVHKILRKGRLANNLSLPAARHINEYLDDLELANLLDGDVYFSEIISIEACGEAETYDITVPDYHNFVAEGIISHNSYSLLFIAEQALWAGLRVAFFSLEMRKPQLIRRAWQAWNGQPINKGYVMIPRFELISGGGKPGDELYAVENDKKLKDGIDLSNIDEIQDKIRKRFGGGDIRFVTLPAYSATVDDIIAHIDNLTWYDNFIPDVVIVDYADIIKPSKSAGTEYRHQLDSIWKGLRALAQSRNIHVCTASQTNRAGMRGDVELEHVAEDMRKLAHVSLLLALNSKPEEREQNIIRIKTLLNRDDSVMDGNEAVVLSQLSIGKFYLDSKLRKNVEKTDIVD